MTRQSAVPDTECHALQGAASTTARAKEKAARAMKDRPRGLNCDCVRPLLRDAYVHRDGCLGNASRGRRNHDG